MSEIEELLAELGQAAGRHDWQRCAENCFRILYGMPEEVQLALAVSAMRRYLPIFRLRWPGIEWPGQMLDQPAQWVARHGCALPEEPEAPNPADASFLFAFDALCNGLSHRADHAVLTSSHVVAVTATINARATNVWMADDPEAVALWQAQSYFPGRSVADNAAAVAVFAREWRQMADSIAERQRGQPLSAAGPSANVQALERWRDHGYSLITPPGPAQPGA